MRALYIPKSSRSTSMTNLKSGPWNVIRTRKPVNDQKNARSSTYTPERSPRVILRADTENPTTTNDQNLLGSLTRTPKTSVIQKNLLSWCRSLIHDA